MRKEGGIGHKVTLICPAASVSAQIFVGVGVEGNRFSLGNKGLGDGEVIPTQPTNGEPTQT